MRWLWIVLSLFLLAACEDVDGGTDSTDLCATESLCESEEERSQSGERLQVLNQDWTGADGSVIAQPAGAFDTKLGVECNVEQGQDGQWRCYPKAQILNPETPIWRGTGSDRRPYNPLGEIYVDEACEVLAIHRNLVDPYLCREDAEYFRREVHEEVTLCDGSQAYDARIHSIMNTRYKYYHVPGGLQSINWVEPDELYVYDYSSCSIVASSDWTYGSINSIDEYYIFTPMEEYELSEEEFVKMER